MILYFCLHYWKWLSSLSLFQLSVSQYLKKDGMCYVAEEGKYNAASVDSIRFCCLLCCPLFSMMLYFLLYLICTFYIMVKHTIILIDKRSVINVSHVNVTLETLMRSQSFLLYESLQTT